jgi:hypothetical protein
VYRESDGSDEDEEVVLDDDVGPRDKGSPRGKGTPRKAKGQGQGQGQGRDDKDKDKDGEKRVVSYWTQTEKDEFLRLFKKHGRNWAKLSALIPGKTPQQIKNYFQNYKVKLNLIALLEEGSALDPGNPHLQVRYRRKRAGKSEGDADADADADADDSLDAEQQVLVCPPRRHGSRPCLHCIPRLSHCAQPAPVPGERLGAERPRADGRLAERGVEPDGDGDGRGRHGVPHQHRHPADRRRAAEPPRLDARGPAGCGWPVLALHLGRVRRLCVSILRPWPAPCAGRRP